MDMDNNGENSTETRPAIASVNPEIPKASPVFFSAIFYARLNGFDFINVFDRTQIKMGREGIEPPTNRKIYILLYLIKYYERKVCQEHKEKWN